MALIPLHPGVQPYGEFDIVDTEMSSILGGEVMALTTASRTNTLTETAAYDVLDGYEYATTSQRPAATRASTATQFPLFLSDDGTSSGGVGTSTGYLTYFGRIVGANVGTTTNGTVLGPATMTGSGKVTLWAHQGLYGVTLDACASDFVSSIGPGGLAINSIIGFGSGADLGKLCHTSCANKVVNSGVARLVEFSRSESLVTTPAHFFSASVAFDRIKIFFNGGMETRTL